jgi:hypothetical protein
MSGSEAKARSRPCSWVKLPRAHSPTVVHSPVTASTSSSRYGVVPAYLPFSIYRPWRREELTQERPVSARARLGLEPGQVPIGRAYSEQRSLAPYVPIPTKPPVYNGMIAPRDSWMMPPPLTR